MATPVKIQYYDAIPYQSALDLKDGIGFLLVTATDLETRVLHTYLTALPGYEKILKVVNEKQTYFLGCFGVFGIVHVQCEMGSTGAGASSITVRDGIDAWQPKAAIMLGIAFGIDDKKQKIGDVLVSECVLPYDHRKVTSTGVTQRGTPRPADRILLNRFKNHTDWNYNLPNGLKPNVIVGHILSGECLIDNAVFRNALLEKYDHAQGGEMEGVGFAGAAESKNIPWIIVKSICDFADGNKCENKAKFQETAANSAISFSQNILNNKLAFEEINIFGIDKTFLQENENQLLNPKHAQSVLFTHYTPEKESYYIIRDHDEKIQNILPYSNLWVWGPIGCGKTSLTMRALYRNFTIIKVVSFANYNRADLISLFGYFLMELLDCLKDSADQYIPNEDLTIVVKRICALLIAKSEENICIYIEEVSNIDKNILDSFVQHIFGILLSIKGKCSNFNIKFVFSSINEPLANAKKETKNKIHEHINFYQLTPWEYVKIAELLTLIVKELKLNLVKNDFDKIINAANGSPRFIKRLIQKHLIVKSASTLDALINETKGELF